MSLLFMDCMRTGLHSGKWGGAFATHTTGAGARSYGGAYARDGNMVKSTGLGSGSELFTGFAMKWHSSASTNAVTFYEGNQTTAHIAVSRNATSGFLQAHRGTSGGTIIATGTTVIPDDTWTYIEIRTKVHDSTGAVQVRLGGSGSNEINFSGDSRNGGAAGTLSSVNYFTYFGANDGVTDVWICDTAGSVNNGFLGDVRPVLLLPDGVGTHNDFTGSDGNATDNHLLVDEEVVDSADYTLSSTIGEQETYTLAALPGGVSSVLGVQVQTHMRKSDSGTRTAKALTRSSSTEVLSSEYTLTTSTGGSSVRTVVYEQDPATTAAWTTGGVNALEVGAEVIT